ncbi:MAG: hypothetical protein IT210_07920 [Armatimonadetes bacterium]|nr:hypothetical protein [Armatimonadota bacterium]
MDAYRERKSQPESFSGGPVDLWYGEEHVGKAGRWIGTILYVLVDASPVQGIGSQWEIEKASWSGILSNCLLDRGKLAELVPDLNRLRTLELRAAGRINGKGMVEGTILFDPVELPTILVTKTLKFKAGTPQLA